MAAVILPCLLISFLLPTAIFGFGKHCDPDSLKLFKFTQKLDHFTYTPESNTTFIQYYSLNTTFWGGPGTNSPIFVFLGAEMPLLDQIGGFIEDHALQFGALVVYIEHRYYGFSVPFHLSEETFKNATTLGYLTVPQALADYAEVIVSLKRNLSAENCPVIVFGGSYGGMLASWFRLKYPHIALGALASSAPLLYLGNSTLAEQYYVIASRVFKEASECCFDTIRQSWSKIDDIASQENGLLFLSQKFNTCSPLNSSSDLKSFLKLKYASAAQYDYVGSPVYQVNSICEAIDKASEGNDTLSSVLTGLKALLPVKSCLQIPENYNTLTDLAFRWQLCTELVMPLGISNENTMFEKSPFSFENFTKDCQQQYGVTPNPEWIRTEFGGNDMKQVLEQFGSNIIFSNGLKDPYSAGGVLQNISNSVVAIFASEGSHCADLAYTAQGSNPKWLAGMQNSELNIIKGWIEAYRRTKQEV